MNGFVTYLDPQPHPAELPLRLANPFGVVPHLLAQHAALALQQNLAAGDYFAADEFTGFQRGKMFGVLLVRDTDARIGFIKAFSGMAQDSWLVDGFAGPLFDLEARDAVWPAGQAELGTYTAQLNAIEAFVATMPDTGSSEARARALADRRELRERRAQRSNELLEHMRSGYRMLAMKRCHCVRFSRRTRLQVVPETVRRLSYSPLLSNTDCSRLPWRSFGGAQPQLRGGVPQALFTPHVCTNAGRFCSTCCRGGT